MFLFFTILIFSTILVIVEIKNTGSQVIWVWGLLTTSLSAFPSMLLCTFSHLCIKKTWVEMPAIPQNVSMCPTPNICISVVDGNLHLFTFSFANFLENCLKFALDLVGNYWYLPLKIHLAHVQRWLAHFIRSTRLCSWWCSKLDCSLLWVMSARGAKTHKRCWKGKKEDEEMFFGSVAALVKLPLLSAV